MVPFKKPRWMELDWDLAVFTAVVAQHACRGQGKYRVVLCMQPGRWASSAFVYPSWRMDTDILQEQIHKTFLTETEQSQPAFPSVFPLSPELSSVWRQQRSLPVWLFSRPAILLSSFLLTSHNRCDLVSLLSTGNTEDESRG